MVSSLDNLKSHSGLSVACFKGDVFQNVYRECLELPFPSPHLSDLVALHGRGVFAASREILSLMQETNKLVRETQDEVWVVDLGDKFYSLPSMEEIREGVLVQTPQVEKLINLREKLLNTYTNLKSMREMTVDQRKVVNESLVFTAE